MDKTTRDTDLASEPPSDDGDTRCEGGGRSHDEDLIGYGGPNHGDTGDPNRSLVLYRRSNDSQEGQGRQWENPSSQTRGLTNSNKPSSSETHLRHSYPPRSSNSNSNTSQQRNLVRYRLSDDGRFHPHRPDSIQNSAESDTTITLTVQQLAALVASLSNENPQAPRQSMLSAAGSLVVSMAASQLTSMAWRTVPPLLSACAGKALGMLRFRWITID